MKAREYEILVEVFVHRVVLLEKPVLDLGGPAVEEELDNALLYEIENIGISVCKALRGLVV